MPFIAQNYNPQHRFSCILRQNRRFNPFLTQFLGPSAAPTAPRRRWQAVITPHNIDTQHDTAPLRMRQPRTTSGVRFGWDTTALPRMSPRPSVAKYGATHSGNPSRGSELPRLYRRCSAAQGAGWRLRSHALLTQRNLLALLAPLVL